MNKKFSTLMASLLLAGGVLSSASAVNIATIAGNTKYYKMLRTSQYNAGGAWAAPASNIYLVQEDGIAYASSTMPSDERAAYWKVEKKTLPGSSTVVYKFVNQLGEVLTYTDGAGNKQTEFYTSSVTGVMSGYDANTILQTAPGAGTDAHIYMSYTTDGAENPIDWKGYTSLTTNEWALAFDFVEIDEDPISVKDLNAELQNGFQIQIGKSGKNAYEEFENWAETEKGFGNVFAGKLTAVDASDGSSTNSNGEEFYLKSGDKYIVLTDALWGGTNSDLNGKDHYKGYQFELVSAHAFASVNKKNATFKIEKTYDFDQAYGDSLIVSMPEVKVGDMATETDVRLFVAEVNNKSYLTIIESEAANDRLIDEDALELPYVRFGASNIVDFKDFAGKVWNITNQGKSLSPDAKSDAELDNFFSEFDPEGEVMLNAPEGEWLPYYETENNYGFVNRESGIKWNLGYTDGAGNYWVVRNNGNNNYTVWSSKYATDSNTQLQYTINITEAASKVGKQADGSYKSFTEAGYARYEDAVKELEGKYITLKNGVTGATMYVGKNADDEVILTEDQTEAIEFRVKELKHDYTAHDGYAAVDTLHHYTTYYGYDEDGNLSMNVQDTVQFQHFRLFEHFSEKALIYNTNADNKGEHKFILSEIESTENAHEDFNAVIKGDNNINNIFSTFVLKKKADGNYNLVSYYNIIYPTCTGNHTNVKGDFSVNYIETNLYKGYGSENRVDGRYYLSMKMEGNVGKATVDNTANIYTHTNEDRFALVDIETPEYMTITGSQDTVKISLQAKPNFFLYEQGKNGTNFLGMDHVADVEDMKAAILADTAYVRYNTYKPQYLLAVGTDIVKPIYDNAGHMLEPDTVYGRFLVNMVDSAKTYGLDKKSNPYIWEELNGNPYYRLAFVDGYHTGDALTLNTAKAKTKIALNNNNDKVCTFAFRYVDESREGVKIETAYGPADANGNRSRGWLKYQNNVPVVTPDYEDAHVFTVDNTTTDAPTANETISAGNVVVAGTNGAVVVKGAEGKNVIVSTILGKVVANEVVSSDNAQITAPAGIVVVSVDGESFKVVVK